MSWKQAQMEAAGIYDALRARNDHGFVGMVLDAMRRQHVRDRSKSSKPNSAAGLQLAETAEAATANGVDKDALIQAVGFIASDLSRGLTDTDIRASWKRLANAAGIEDVRLSDEELAKLRSAAAE